MRSFSSYINYFVIKSRRRSFLLKLCLFIAIIFLLSSLFKNNRHSISQNEIHNLKIENADILKDLKLKKDEQNDLIPADLDNEQGVPIPGEKDKELADENDNPHPAVDIENDPNNLLPNVDIIGDAPIPVEDEIQAPEVQNVNSGDIIINAHEKDEKAEIHDRSERERAENLFSVDEAKIVPGLGEGGAAVTFSSEENEEAEAIIKVEAFNLIASDKISVNRSLPDIRDPMCKNLLYTKPLPSASVIIIFNNERWSTLIRTVHSVINRSPPELLKEILLVDDFSDREELGEKLDLYIKYRLPTSKIKLIRLTERQGLIRARTQGAIHATGDVLIFLDSHSEATYMWLEPLVHRIKISRTSVLVPVIESINYKTLQFIYSIENSLKFMIGGFTWAGHYTWTFISDNEKKRRESEIAPTRTPTMAGGLFAIERKYFWDIGGYDDGMEIWGGENLEMSFRIWMCGGTLEVIPCSRVGHIFRPFSPFSFPGKKDTHGLNTARMAEVWMDDYKENFYRHKPKFKTADIGDITARKELRQRLKCHNFKWFLDNVMPEMFRLEEDSIRHGKVRSNSTTPNLCLDNFQVSPERKPFLMGLHICHSSYAYSQQMFLTRSGELRREESCATVRDSDTQPPEKRVLMVMCHNVKNQKWLMTKSGQIFHEESNLCLDSSGKSAKSYVAMMPCNDLPHQQWTFEP